MSFLLDTDTCSVHLKRPAGLTSRLVQHAGRLHVSIITVGELMTCVIGLIALGPAGYQFE